MDNCTRFFACIPLALALGGVGCDSGGDDGTDASDSGDSGDGDTHADDGGTQTDDDSGSSDGGSGTDDGGDSGLPDLDEESILAWLEAGSYTSWTAESAIHPSAGPHGQVRVFINPALEMSFMDAADAHPQGAAAVKELYDSSMQSLGWVVAIKAEPDSAEGDNWFWFEYRDGDTFVADFGSAVCTGCHSYGTDYIRTTYPLN